MYITAAFLRRTLRRRPQEKSEAEKFLLVGWSQLQCFYPVPRGKNFSACEKFFCAYFFGHKLRSIALACHGFASAGAVTLGSALSPPIPPLGMFRVERWGCSL